MTLAAAVRISLLALAPAAPVSAADPVRPQRFACEIRLASQAGISAPSPVTIEFTSQGKTMQGIRVLDVGGILYPGGNLSISTRPDGTVVMGAKPLPQERPGRWSGRASKRSFDLGLATVSNPKAAIIRLGTKAGLNGDLPLTWQATGEPMMPGAPSISGSGTGSCRSVTSGAPTS